MLLLFKSPTWEFCKQLALCICALCLLCVLSVETSYLNLVFFTGCFVLRSVASRHPVGCPCRAGINLERLLQICFSQHLPCLLINYFGWRCYFNKIFPILCVWCWWLKTLTYCWVRFKKKNMAEPKKYRATSLFTGKGREETSCSCRAGGCLWIKIILELVCRKRENYHEKYIKKGVKGWFSRGYTTQKTEYLWSTWTGVRLKR